MENQRGSHVPSSFCQVERVHNQRGIQGFRKAPGNDPAGEKVHDAGEVNESCLSPDVGNIRTPGLIGTVGVKVFVEDIVEFCTVIAIPGRSGPMADPLCPNPHLLHVFTDRAL